MDYVVSMKHDIARNFIIVAAKNFPQNRISKMHYPLYGTKILPLPYKFANIFILKYICIEVFNYYIWRIMIVTILKKFPFLLYCLFLITTPTK